MHPGGMPEAAGARNASKQRDQLRRHPLPLASRRDAEYRQTSILRWCSLRSTTG